MSPVRNSPVDEPPLPLGGANLLAPLAGYSDEPFRRVCRKTGCFYAFTPLVDAQAVVHAKDRNRTLLHRGEGEPWLGVQLLGSVPAVLAEAARRLRDSDFQVLDFNLGCPVPKVYKRGAGAALLENPDLATACVAALASASDIPVTAKIRVLDSGDPSATVRFCERLTSAGVSALTIHGRVREQYYSGPVDTDCIRAVREALPVPVIANGGVFTGHDARLLRQTTGCSRIMVARGAIGNPWVFREVDNPEAAPPSHAEVCSCLEEQLRGMIDLYGETIAMRTGRKVIAAYLKGRGTPRSMRWNAMQLTRTVEFDRFLRQLRSLRDDREPCPRAHRADELGEETGP